uniref:snRNA-activating protein complex subunit 4 n=1 Tax=Aceria tosichella TaxID=561515 RepID=A0A6G1SDF7_9ACAR
MMDHQEDQFLALNKFIEDKLDHLNHLVETRLDKLFNQDLGGEETPCSSATNKELAINGNHPNKQQINPYSSNSFATFRAPYIRDFRNFSAPTSEDTKQIQQLTGIDDIDQLIQSKSWTRESKQQLEEAVLEHYAKLHIIKLIKQKNELLESPTKQNDEDVSQKLQLIEQQLEQVKARKEPRIFVPENRLDTQIDWCAISAKVTSQHDAQDCRLMWSNQLHWSVNSDSVWTKDEDICLINAVAKHGKNDWDIVARELNSGRLAWQCCARYNQEYAFVRLPLDKDEGDKITEVINLCRIGNYVPWNQVMYFIQYHSLQQVKWQWQKYCSEQRDTSNWTHQEDYILLRSVRKYGERDWLRIAECLPGRTNKSCRERYIMRLKSATRAVGGWRKFEDTRLTSLVERFGTNWSLISSYLPERNCHQLRNRFELLKHEFVRPCPLKRRKLIRLDDGQFVQSGHGRRLTQEAVDTNRRLREIFSTFSSVSKNSTKSSLTCRSAQDEMIYQSLVKVLRNRILAQNPEQSLLETILNKAIEPNPGLFMPSIPTIRAYKAWSLQQHYLRQFDVSNDDQDQSMVIDDQILKIVVSIFLWPAILARLKRPEINANDYLVGSLLERNSKNLYKIRDIQRQITK